MEAPPRLPCVGYVSPFNIIKGDSGLTRVPPKPTQERHVFYRIPAQVLRVPWESLASPPRVPRTASLFQHANMRFSALFSAFASAHGRTHERRRSPCVSATKECNLKKTWCGVDGTMVSYDRRLCVLSEARPQWHNKVTIMRYDRRKMCHRQDVLFYGLISP